LPDVIQTYYFLREGFLSIRLATFNAENLFARYNFNKNYTPVAHDGFTINDLAFDIYDETDKEITAQAMREVNADVFALQEIESLPVLDTFNSKYLGTMKYRHRILIDSFDPRKIDVAILSRFPIISVRSHRQERNAANSAWLFSRDCLVVTLDVNGKELILYINHFKSMMGGRSETYTRRKEQVDRVAAILDERWQSKKYKGNFVVLGDFNDYPEGNTALSSLIQHPGLENVVKRLPPDDQWTHFYAEKKQYKQLDYILLSKSLAQINPKPPAIMRKGISPRAVKYTGPRFPKVVEEERAASDHAPLSIDIELG
jgi:endonuclease/exonuclease/phosphatase family metal-dependent hydrolase